MCCQWILKLWPKLQLAYQTFFYCDFQSRSRQSLEAVLERQILFLHFKVCGFFMGGLWIWWHSPFVYLCNVRWHWLSPSSQQASADIEKMIVERPICCVIQPQSQLMRVSVCEEEGEIGKESTSVRLSLLFVPHCVLFCPRGQWVRFYSDSEVLVL